MTASGLSEFDPANGKRGEFGELARQSGRSLNEISLAQITGAENLLTKAVSSAAAGNRERAEQLIQRAAAMSYDPREERSPGIAGAEILIYSLVSDQFESSTQEDTAWLDVAIAVHAEVDGPGNAELASAVHGFVLQKPFFSLSAAEERRIRETFGDAPLEADLGDGPDLTVEERREIIGSLLATASALGEGYGRVSWPT
jgi:hypothetical protein